MNYIKHGGIALREWKRWTVEEDETQIDKCHFCGSSRINKVDTWHDNVVEAYYCINCLREFLPNGELIPPLYADGCEGW